MRIKRFMTTVALVAGLCVGGIHGANGNPGAGSLQRLNGAAYQSMSELIKTSPGVQFFGQAGKVSCLYGVTLETGSSPEETARRFLEGHTDLFGARYEQLVPQVRSRAGLHTQPMMYNASTGKYKFTQAHYSQSIDGVPVFRSEVHLLMRNDIDYPLVMARSTLRDLSNYAGRGVPTVDRQMSTARILSDNPGLEEFSEPEAVIWAGLDSAVSEARPAVIIHGSSSLPELWLYVIDAETGEILYKEDRIILDDVQGEIGGNSTDGAASPDCEDESIKPLPYARVTSGDDTCYADSAGRYSLEVDPTWPVDVVSMLRGEHFFVVDSAGNDASMSYTFDGEGFVDFVHNEANVDDGYLAQVNAYSLANEIRDYVLTIHPDYPGVRENLCPKIVVNYGGEGTIHCPCNAWYVPWGEHSINFCAGGYHEGLGLTCSNSAYSSILFHEYGHHVIEMAGCLQNEYGEGMADAISVLLRDNSINGRGLFGSCDSYVRDADNEVQFPCEGWIDGGIHYCGQVLSGCIWDLRNELSWRYPSTYMDTLANLTINSVLLHGQGDGCIRPDIVLDFLVLDDDDTDISNGTPNMLEICSAFGQHNMRCPDFAIFDFAFSEEIPDFIGLDQSYTVQVEITPRGMAEPLPGTGMFYYAINDSDYQQGTMVELAANVYEISFPQVPGGGAISWYLTAESDLFGTINEPASYEEHPYELIVAIDKVLLFEDDFSEHRGWETEIGELFWGDSWIRDIPITGDDVLGSPPLEDYDGSGYCYLTGNTPDDVGVRHGSATLTSPELSFENGVVRVEYARWLDNRSALLFRLPDDTFYVHLSPDSGQTWQLAEKLDPYYGEQSGGWFTNQVLINRYLASPTSLRLRYTVDNIEDHIVNGIEAGIDAVKVYFYPCNTGLAIYTSYLPESTVGQPYSMQLEATGGDGVLTWADKYNNLESTGLSLSSSGLITGTPVVSGEFLFTAEVTDGAGLVDERPYTAVINSAFNIINNFPSVWTMTAYLGVYFETDGGTPTFNWSNPSNSLDSLRYEGLVLERFDMADQYDRWGVNGFPHYEEDSIWFNIAGQDAAGACDTLSVTIHFNPDLRVHTVEMAPATFGKPYDFQIDYSGGTPPYRWYNIHKLLPELGLYLDQETGRITGTPDSVGIFSVQISVFDSCNDVWHPGYDDGWPLELVISLQPGCGDIDHDGEDVNISDITYFSDWMFAGGPPPPVMVAADVDGSGGSVDISDLVYLVDYMFGEGLPPICVDLQD